MANMSAQEQLMLELTNRARMDPTGEAKRFGIALNEGVSSGDTISTKPKQVLAGNDDLIQAANNHSKWMLAHDEFEHSETKNTSGFTGEDPGDRMSAAGYKFTGSSAWGENIAVRGSSEKLTSAMLTQFIIQQHEDLFVDEGIAGRGHRLNILSSDFSEVGIGQESGSFAFSNGTFNSSMVTQDFARSGSKLFVTGVVYNDTVVKDNFFSVGEQTAGRTVSASGVSDKTGAGGGYELAFSSGSARTVKFDLAGDNVSVGLGAFKTNIKVDVVNGKEVWANADITSVSSNVTQLHALGIENIDLTAKSGAQALFGNKGANVLNGGSGNDVLIGSGGVDKLTGGTGSDEFRFYKGDTGSTNAKADIINDFTSADLIDLERWDANSNKSGDQDFSFIGSKGFSKHEGQLRAIQSSGDTFIQGDTNGDGHADLIIKLEGKHSLTGADFDL